MIELILSIVTVVCTVLAFYFGLKAMDEFNGGRNTPKGRAP